MYTHTRYTCRVYCPTDFRYTHGAFLCEGSLGVFARRCEAAVVLSHAVYYNTVLVNKRKTNPVGSSPRT